MQIKPQETVQNTLAKYKWDDSKNWTKSPLGGYARTVYQKNGLSIYQYKQKNCQGVVFETPKYMVYITAGTWNNIVQPHKKTKSHFYSLSVSSTLSDRTIYRSIMDTAGYKDICGDRDIFLDLLEKVPPQYIALEKDENAKYVSTYWMRVPRLFARKHHTHRLLKEIE